MKRFLNPILGLMLLASISIVPVSCTIDGNDDNPAVTPAEQQGFFSDAINKLIDRKLRRSDLPWETASYVDLDHIDPVTRQAVRKSSAQNQE